MYTSSSFGTTNNGAAKCSLKNEDRDDNFDVRPPSGTNHQQPGKHLSIDTRFAELSLETSLFAESERKPPQLTRYVTRGTFSRTKTPPNRVQVSKGNFYVTSPFKQGSGKDIKGPISVVDPSHDLKQRTIANVERVKKQVQRENKARNRLHHSQLLKGSLKTLGRPMTASGPRIRSCQGIVAGVKSRHGFVRYHTNNSFIDNDNFSHRKLPETDGAIISSTRPESCPLSSIHRTSIASSVDRFNVVIDGDFSDDVRANRIDMTCEVGDLQDPDKVFPSRKDLRR